MQWGLRGGVDGAWRRGVLLRFGGVRSRSTLASWGRHGGMAPLATPLRRPVMANVSRTSGTRMGRVAALSETVAGAPKGVQAATEKLAPRKYLKGEKAVGYWLLGVAGAVFGMVVLGGVTRLTRSGLSMVDWRPQGSLLPSTNAEWMLEFEKYKQFPEYQKLNMGMTLDEFKKIYFMEWLHRMWGRGLGIVFGVPLVYFLARGKVQKIPGLAPKLAGLLLLGGSQGLVGWWMVKSGLEEPVHDYREPRVSPYRLTAHLTMALALYSGLIWSGLTALNPNRAMAITVVRKLQKKGLVALALVGVTFVSGAFVAGNDAGRAYNDWPMYAGNWIPAEIWDNSLSPSWRNFFENTATVQFDHRSLAYLTLLTVIGTWVMARRPANWKALQPASQKSYHAMLAVVFGQVALGISTLMLFVPVELASLHQAGALTLWSTVLYSQHSLRFLRSVPK